MCVCMCVRTRETASACGFSPRQLRSPPAASPDWQRNPEPPHVSSPRSRPPTNQRTAPICIFPRARQSQRGEVCRVCYHGDVVSVRDAQFTTALGNTAEGTSAHYSECTLCRALVCTVRGITRLTGHFINIYFTEKLSPSFKQPSHFKHV